MRILITGANGFIGKNLQVRLGELHGYTIRTYCKDQSLIELEQLVNTSDFIFHLAGINRPQNPAEFTQGNTELTEYLCELIAKSGRNIPIVISSSTQAELDNQYGLSKRAAEEALLKLKREQNNSVYIYRLPNVFGKWSRANYNSAVATFCYNIAHDLPIMINDPLAKLNLVYIDDVVAAFVSLLTLGDDADVNQSVMPVYQTTVGDLANMIESFKDSIVSGITPRVGTGLVRALYSTYLSFLPLAKFSYPLVKHEDPRGSFVEMLKTPDCGQFSFFTAHPGITRGGHYHHTKTEKFLVIKGRAKYRFRQIFTDEYYELEADGNNPIVVETIPGWSHDITNIGADELVVMLWANEIFDREKPDTVGFKVN